MSFLSGELLLFLFSKTLTKQTRNSGGIIINNTWERCFLCAGWTDVLLHSSEEVSDLIGSKDFLPQIFKVGRSFKFIFLQEFFVFCNT